MFQFFLLFSLIASTFAYDGNYAIGGGYGSGKLIGSISGISSGLSGGVIPVAVQTHHNIQYMNAPSRGYINPVFVEIGASAIPINMIFHSRSSNLNVRQQHIGSSGSFQETASQDEPHILRHTVTKPIFQEIREVVTPFRRVTQEIRPVVESINTIVARSANAGQGFISGSRATGGLFGRPHGIGGITGATNFGFQKSLYQ